MRKRVLTLLIALVLVFVSAIPAMAAGPEKASHVTLSMSFSGTTANCAAQVTGNNTSDSVSMTVKLWKGSTCLKTWTASGTGKASLSRTATVSHGQTYKLTVNAKINGVAQPQRSITKTCP